jgi:hypothetical protein
MRLQERIGGAQFWVDDEGPMDSGSKPGAVCMPPKCAFLAFYGEAVRVALTGSDRALSHKLRPISPCGSRLSDSMPVSPEYQMKCGAYEIGKHLSEKVIRKIAP